jgi:FixJ family two-component response regulator
LPDQSLIFVVDDGVEMLRSLARLLRQLGYASLLFPSAEAFANHDDFEAAACILLDIDLGEVSGIVWTCRNGFAKAGGTCLTT